MTGSHEHLKTVCSIAEEAFAAAGVDFYYLIGAAARDLYYTREGLTSRTTRDVDFALLVADAEQFVRVKDILKSHHDFQDYRGNAFTLVRDEIKVDILPFGGLTEDDRTVIGGEGLTSIRVAGFAEVGKAGVEEFETDGATFRVATLPGIVLLKFIALDDRPESRPNDAGDIVSIVANYYNLDGTIFYKHYDVLENIDAGHDLMGARVMGRELRPILALNPELDARVRRILHGHLAVGMEMFLKPLGGDRHHAEDLFRQMLVGLDEDEPMQ